MNIVLHTVMQDYGQMVDRVTVTGSEIPDGLTAEDFELKDCFNDLSAKIPCGGITGIVSETGKLELTVDPFLYRIETFEIQGKSAAAGIVINRKCADSVELLHEDWFEAKNENGVNYRLYSPEGAVSPRPLVLFLHGGGGSGEDNLLQLTDTLGAIKLAERNPDMYVMAPQAPAGGLTMEEAFARIGKGARGKHGLFEVVVGADPDNAFDSRGWVRWYLAKVADIIRGMIAEGKVDPKRVYCTGMSMGGGGTLKMLSVAPDLFAAAAPICPSMNGETYAILENLPQVPVYIATSYIDHQPARHAYIQRAVHKLLKAGRKDVEYVIFTPEEMAVYGMGVTQDLTTPELYAENHNVWIMVLHNEYCILDWMYSHVKE